MDECLWILTDFYLAHSEVLDMSDPVGSCDKINSWVEESNVILLGMVS